MIPNRSYTRQDRLRIIQILNADEHSESNILIDSANEAFLQAATETMEVMGYNVIAENGWVVKVFLNGEKENIKKIGRTHKNADSNV